MAIYHNSTKIISRSSGRSAVGASAYRSGEKIKNEYDGMEHNYSRKQGVVYSEIMIPSQAKEEFKNRSVLWNEVEKIEKSKNSQLAREVEVALPKELNRDEQIELVKSYIQDNFIKNGMCADLNIHDKGDGNPHAHIMLTMRPIKENGEWGAKSKKEYILDKNGEKIKLKSGQYKSRKIDSTNWNTKEFLESYREDWANKINEKFKELGIKQRVDHRSYEEQGIEKLPSIHDGATARKMESMGKVSDRMEINRKIKVINEKIKQCSIDIHQLKSEITKFENSVNFTDKADIEKINITDRTSSFGSEGNNIMENINELKEKLSDSLKKQLEIDVALKYMDKRKIKTINDMEYVRSQLSDISNIYSNKISKINDYIKQMDSIYDSLVKKVKEVNSLEKEVAELGIFKFKQKRDLNNKIQKLKSEINELKESEFYQGEKKYSGKLEELKGEKEEYRQILIKCDNESKILYNIKTLNENKKKYQINLNRNKDKINIKKHSNDLEL